MAIILQFIFYMLRDSNEASNSIFAQNISPKKNNSLFRLGSKFDGGYVFLSQILKNQIYFYPLN